MLLRNSGKSMRFLISKKQMPGSAGHLPFYKMFLKESYFAFAAPINAQIAYTTMIPITPVIQPIVELSILFPPHS